MLASLLGALPITPEVAVLVVNFIQLKPLLPDIYKHHWVSLVAERNVSISSAEGMEVCAPLTVAESAAAAEALRRDSFTEMPNDSEQAKTPQKQSPAPTVSTTLTVKAS